MRKPQIDGHHGESWRGNLSRARWLPILVTALVAPILARLLPPYAKCRSASLNLFFSGQDDISKGTVLLKIRYWFLFQSNSFLFEMAWDYFSRSRGAPDPTTWGA